MKQPSEEDLQKVADQNRAAASVRVKDISRALGFCTKVFADFPQKKPGA